MKKIVLIMGLLMFMATAAWAVKDDVVLIEGWVPFINEHYLYINERQYPISKDVKVVLGSEDGTKITLSTITGVGFIDRAKVYVEKGIVRMIVIMEVSQ